MEEQAHFALGKYNGGTAHWQVRGDLPKEERIVVKSKVSVGMN